MKITCKCGNEMTPVSQKGYWEVTTRYRCDSCGDTAVTLDRDRATAALRARGIKQRSSREGRRTGAKGIRDSLLGGAEWASGEPTADQ